MIDTKEYEAHLPKLAELAGMTLAHSGSKYLFVDTNSDDKRWREFRPLHEDGDCFKLLSGMMKAIQEFGCVNQVGLYFSRDWHYCDIAELTTQKTLFEECALNPRESVVACAIAYLKSQEAGNV